MKTATSSPKSSMAKAALARVPYLNCAPFFYGMPEDEAWQWSDISPRQFGAEAEAGRLDGGAMSLIDYVRLQDRVERIGHLGIAVSGRSGSALLFSRKPIRQLGDCTIAVSDETSTTALLLRLILEQRYKLTPAAYQRGPAGDADAVLLIGDDALRLRANNRLYPYEVDLSFEWWLWQHRPFVFALWVVRKDAEPGVKQRLSRLLFKMLATNIGRLQEVATARAASVGLSAEQVKAYLENFTYRLSEPEEQAISLFKSLVDEHHLL